MLTAAYTFSVAVVSGRGRPRYLEAARLGAYGTVSLIGLAILCLAYAFVTHDFRIKYVAHYSDRTMPVGYLLTALWGGQDGSLLWWLFLLSIYTAVCVRWLKGKYRELQPYVIATLMVIVLFFCVLMTFAANPFSTSVAGARLDGEGLNPLLQNFYMIIHPPSLYTGFVGCSVPFSFAVAALVTGRLNNEWLAATRNWMLFAWLFLSIGNALGMLWAYEELGWGGYWAWDPVENAAFLPWLTATAFVHSLMIQERRGMLKVWNVSLVLLTFFLTIFGTFLTRSGLIASVHSFAQSNIGTYFVGFLGILIAACTGLVVWRLPRMRSEGRIEAVLSREAAFLANNWAFLGIMVFILVATTFPRISEWLMQQESTVGPTFYNAWLPPAGLFLFALMGIGPLLAWRKTSQRMFKRSFIAPIGAGLVVAILHVAVGSALRFPAFVTPDRIYEGFVGTALQKIGTVLPLVSTFLCAFNVAVVVQEYARGIRARRRSSDESLFAALMNLVGKARHRYGGYIVHLGIVLLFIGFTGRSWGVDKEVSLRPGESFTVDHYELKYSGPRMEVDQTKRMVFADLAVVDTDSGNTVGQATPAKFIYRKMQESPTTEVSMLHSVRDDLYVVVGTVSPETKVATFQVHVNPLVSWIWTGVFVLIFGVTISMWPEVSLEEARAWSFLRAAGAGISSIMLAILLALTPTRAFGQASSSSSLHAGSVEIHDPVEQSLFNQLRCMCGGCARLPLSGCVCGTAEGTRAEIRAKLRQGISPDEIISEYVHDYGAAALSVPPNRGALKSIYLVPVAAAVGGLGVLFTVVRRWKRQGDLAAPPPPTPGGSTEVDEYDAKLDDELKKLDDD
jgi:cytochrome c-type biogenesis protein CcmF